MTLRKTRLKINPEKIYNISGMREEKLFWWATDDHRTYKGIIEKDRRIANVLKTIVIGEGRRREYRIKGFNIIIFLERYGEGIAIANQHNGKKENDKA